jgi:hypothetical protein
MIKASEYMDEVDAQKNRLPWQLSIIFPRYIITILSAILRIKLRSCVINKYDIPSCLCKRIKVLIIFACTETSSAEVGSSRTIIDGSVANARAIATICLSRPQVHWNTYKYNLPEG